ncbi:fimbrial protein [Escherichia coli]|uniref:fimbrial protein n=1 Tax=Escherichia coli TaxID=562 RepID=UPI0019CEF127|nr:fimbrial protein [Escherichia coli]CAD6107411.1 P-fimbriae major subunit [Escherichia coli]CAD6111041.1 P-fimbriae major subunit [Escherichia coli]CAD6180971.1 P-fimbriae major subunit [Escherichia coli]
MSIKSKLVMAGLVAMSMASMNAMAASGNSGTVTFSGEVVDTPCNLAPGQDGTDVKVDFGQLSMAQLNAGVKTSEPFTLKLQNCALTTTATDGTTTTKTASITFDSRDADSTNAYLNTHGTAKGLGIGIDGVTFGTESALKGIVDGDNELRFTAVAQKAGTDAVTAGNFSAATNFTISYK